VLAAYFCKIFIWLAVNCVINTDRQAAQPAATFHQGGGQICIRLAACQMQISFGWSPAACKLLKNLGILYCMAASRMQFALGWRPTE
jgi:hypothetical protein